MSALLAGIVGGLVVLAGQLIIIKYTKLFRGPQGFEGVQGATGATGDPGRDA